MLTKSILTVFVFNCLIIKSLQQFKGVHEQEYLNKFEILKRDSYSENLPKDLEFACKNKGDVNGQRTVYINGRITSSEIQNKCDFNVICQIESDAEVTMNSNLNVGALIIKGKLFWNEATQQSNEQWLCAGYIAVRLYTLSKFKIVQYK